MRGPCIRLLDSVEQGSHAGIERECQCRLGCWVLAVWGNLASPTLLSLGVLFDQPGVSCAFSKIRNWTQGLSFQQSYGAHGKLHKYVLRAGNINATSRESKG